MARRHACTYYLQCLRCLRIYQSCACALCMQYRTRLYRYTESKMFNKCLRETFGPDKRDLRVVSVALISPDPPRPYASSPIGGPKVYADFTHARSLPDLRRARYSNKLRLKHETHSVSSLLHRFVLSPTINCLCLTTCILWSLLFSPHCSPKCSLPFIHSRSVCAP